SGVTYISPQVHVMLPARVDSQSDARRQIMMRGATPQALLVHEQVRLLEGRLPTPGADEVMLGVMVPVTLGVPASELQLGNSLTIDGRPWAIVGRFTAPGTVLEGEVWTDLNDL